MANSFLVLCVLFGSLLTQDIAAKSIPSFVPLCVEHSANISECFRNSFNTIVPHLADGIPEMKLWKVEPLVIERQEFRLKNRYLTVAAKLKDLTLYGFKDMKATHIDLDTDNVIIKMDVTIPNINLEGPFEARGALFDIEFNGKGFAIGNFSDLSIKMIWSGRKFVKKNVTYHTMEDGVIDLEIGDIKMHIDGLMPSDRLNAHLNEVIKDNINILFEIAKPVVKDTIKAILLEGMNNVAQNFPFSELYPKNTDEI